MVNRLWLTRDSYGGDYQLWRKKPKKETEIIEGSEFTQWEATTWGVPDAHAWVMNVNKTTWEALAPHEVFLPGDVSRRMGGEGLDDGPIEVLLTLRAAPLAQKARGEGDVV